MSCISCPLFTQKVWGKYHAVTAQQLACASYNKDTKKVDETPYLNKIV